MISFKNKNNFGPSLPGKGLSLTVILIHTGLVILIPLGALLLSAWDTGWKGFVSVFQEEATLYALFLSLRLSLVAALINTLLGLATAWCLVRYQFRLKGLLNSFLDLPLAVPGAVGGIALASFFGSKGLAGRLLVPFGIQISYSPSGILIALVFVGLPFVVRSLQPVIQGLDPQEEEASRLLGASEIRTFIKVLLPPLKPALFSGFVMAFARGIGEYGTVIFIAGNLPFKSEVITQVIYNKIDTYDTQGATVLSLGILMISFLTLLILNRMNPGQNKGGIQ